MLIFKGSANLHRIVVLNPKGDCHTAPHIEKDRDLKKVANMIPEDHSFVAWRCARKILEIEHVFFVF